MQFSMLSGMVESGDQTACAESAIPNACWHNAASMMSASLLFQSMSSGDVRDSPAKPDYHHAHKQEDSCSCE